MTIKRYTSESGNDFSAILLCEHCDAEQKLTSGYHDNFYHTKVLPAITCNGCGRNRAGMIPTTANNNGFAPVIQ